MKKNLNYNVGVIKNIHEHQINKEGKDSFKYLEIGAQFSITKNIYSETTIFLKRSISIEDLINWLKVSPYKIDIVFTEGFRDSNYSTILCVKNLEEVNKQLNDNVKIISGLICLKNSDDIDYLKIPIIDIQKDFYKCLKILEIS